MQHMVATTRCGKETVFWWYAIGKSCTLIAKGGIYNDLIETITDAKEIEDFVSALNVDQWELKPLPDEASKIGTFGLAQEKTIKLGQTDTDGTLYDVATITLYDGSYIGIKIYGLDDLDIIFAVSKDTANYLNGYFE